MNITIQQKTLLSALQKCQKAVSQNRIVPAAENYCFTGANGIIHVSACNLEVSIETDIHATFDADFCIMIPAIKLLDFIKKLPEQPLTISADENHLITIKHNSGNAKMQGDTGIDFPKITTNNGVKLNVNDLASDLSAVAYARGITEDPRPFVYSIWVEASKKECRFVAGDGHVVANIHSTGAYADIKCLLPYAVSNILLSLTGDADLDISKDSITVNIGDMIIKSRLVDSTWPDWNKMVPVTVQTIEVSKSDLLSSLDRVIGFSNQATKLVRITCSGAFLQIESSNPDLNEQSIETITSTPGDFTIQCKGNLLQSALPKFAGDIIKIGFTNEKTALLINEVDSDEYFALVMPSI